MKKNTETFLILIPKKGMASKISIKSLTTRMVSLFHSFNREDVLA